MKLLLAAGADPDARDAQYDSTPRGWARAAIEVENNPNCQTVVDYLDESRRPIPGGRKSGER